MSTSVRFLLPHAVYADMADHAQSELPNECCGALLGRFESREICRIERSCRLRNALASSTEYDADLRDLFKASKEARKRELDIVGFYHSHPTSAPIPSKKDRERNYWGEEVAHFIISLQNETPELRGWHVTVENNTEADWRFD